MIIRIALWLAAYQALLIGLLQVEAISDGIIARILEQYPPLAAVLIAMYWMRKTSREDSRETNDRLEKMLELQRAALADVYKQQQEFVSALLTNIDAKQKYMTDRIELLTQQVAVNTSTVGEIAKVDAIITELIARLERK